MLTIDVEFEPLHELPVAELFGAVGLYTIWASGATHRPTYLGEGVILDRISRHVKRWRSDMLGAAAILTGEFLDKRGAKPRGTIAEAFLLELGDLLGRKPLQNDAPGHTARLYEAVEIHNVVRLNLRGLHPFVHPAERRARLIERAECSVRLDRNGDFVFESPWNARTR